MVGLPKETIAMDINEAKEYVQSKLIVLDQVRNQLVKKLDDINAEIEEEVHKLNMLNNPPSKTEQVAHTDCPSGFPEIVTRLIR